MRTFCLRPELQNYFMIILRCSRFTSTRMLRHCLLLAERFLSLDGASGARDCNCSCAHHGALGAHSLAAVCFEVSFILLFN